MQQQLRADSHNWLQPKYKDQVNCLESIGFAFIGDIDFYYESDELSDHKVGQWQNVSFHCSDYDALDAVIDGGLYSLEIGQVHKKGTIKSIKERLNKAYRTLPKPKQLSLL